MAKPSSASPVHQSWLKEFGRRLRAARHRAGLSQEQLAAPDLTKGFVSLLESARSYPSLETLLTFAQRMHTSVGALLFGAEDLRRETAFNLLHLAWNTDPASRGADALQLVAAAELVASDLPADLRVRAGLVRARIATIVGQLDDAGRHADEAVTLAEQQRLPGALGAALAVRGAIHERRGEYGQAVETLERALDIMRRSKTLASEEGVWALLSLAVARWRRGELEASEAANRRALAIATDLQLPRLRGRALNNLGLLAWNRGQLDRAVELYSQAYAVFEQTEDLPEMGRVLNNLGLIRRTQGFYDEALAVLAKALRIRERQGDLRGRSATFDELARVHLALGHLDEAADAAGRAVADAQAAGDRGREAIAQVTLGRVRRAQRRWAEATEILRAAVSTLISLQMAPEAAAASTELGLLLKETGQSAEAAEFLAQAVTLGAPATAPYGVESPLEAHLVPRDA
ncbi:MAG: tetratricopeptide repeat protein [Armatimonadota bacterium]|nr:tetratricopeptide repeat protein [Armatimonadota bacterium]MDR7533376.1 tetratricopeptide repeat protein [Armatimonadota bacterium]MDR7536496.1 tetratricopeptide repeat protein [Armatimonadota bacterium]